MVDCLNIGEKWYKKLTGSAVYSISFKPARLILSPTPIKMSRFIAVSQHEIWFRFLRDDEEVDLV